MGHVAAGPKKEEATRSMWSILLPYVSGLTLWALLMISVLSVLIAAALMGGREDWLVALKVFVALLLAMVPGWIYLLFIRNKGQSLYDEYVLNLFRLKLDAYENLPAPPQHTNYFAKWNEAHTKVREYLVHLSALRAGTDKSFAPTKDNLYRKKFEAIYGRGSVSTFEMIRERPGLTVRTETFSPVLFATVLICLGWVLILPPHTEPLPTLERSFPRAVPFEALMFGFFGAYAFTIQDLVRRYFRDDLRAGAYIGLVVRIVFTSLVIIVVAVVWTNWSNVNGQTVDNWTPVLAFVVGFFPQAGLQLIVDSVKRPLGKVIPNLRTLHPLSEVDGLNIWYETRLSEEGIEDMQNLVSANLVDLMLKTRAPVARLVDWIDQAFLELHVWPANDIDEKGRRPRRGRSLQRLRGLGIRTATDLERSWERLGNDPVFRRRISMALGLNEAEGPAVVEGILACLDGQVNLWHIREFRKSAWLREAETLKTSPSGDAPVKGGPAGPPSSGGSDASAPAEAAA